MTIMTTKWRSADSPSVGRQRKRRQTPRWKQRQRDNKGLCGESLIGSFTVAGTEVSSNWDEFAGPLGAWKTLPAGMYGEISIAWWVPHGHSGHCAAASTHHKHLDPAVRGGFFEFLFCGGGARNGSSYSRPHAQSPKVEHAILGTQPEVIRAI